MIKAKDAITAARVLVGTPYSELDCINLIKRVIRTAPGGVKDYTTAGTNSLWESYEMSAKYRDLMWRQTGLAGAQAGMLAFKRNGDDVHHVGIVTGDGTVIHSSSSNGRGVVETALDSSWNLLAVHRYIKTADSAGEEERMEALYKAIVTTQKDPLNVRGWPKTGVVLGKVPKGREVEVLSEADEDGWVQIRYNELVGWVKAEYIKLTVREEGEPGGETEENVIRISPEITIIDEEGNTFSPVGSWRVLIGSVD